MIVEIIETDFTPGDYLRMFCEAREFIQMCLRYFLCFVRMNSDGCVNPMVLLGKRHCCVELFRSGTSPNRDEGRDSGRTRTFEHRVAVLCKLRKIYVCV